MITMVNLSKHPASMNDRVNGGDHHFCQLQYDCQKDFSFQTILVKLPKNVLRLVWAHIFLVYEKNVTLDAFLRRQTIYSFLLNNKNIDFWLLVSYFFSLTLSLILLLSYSFSQEFLRLPHSQVCPIGTLFLQMKRDVFLLLFRLTSCVTSLLAVL